MFDLKGKKLVLGSASPRRKMLLESMGFTFEVRSSEIEEIPNVSLSIQEIAEDLAFQKAESIPIASNEILIAADTIVCAENKVLGKPQNQIEAAEMLKTLSNKTHSVLTGLCIKTEKRNWLAHAETKVTFSNLNKSEIEFYIQQYKPMDKAGSYGIQEWIGMIGVQKIDGDYYNVVGLPCSLLYSSLKEMLSTL